MSSSATPTIYEQPDKDLKRGGLLQNLAAVFCILFGIVTVLNVVPAGDGTWYWYADLLRSGQKLYSEMHLALQPLYVLETEAFLVVLGKGWLVSKIPAVLHLTVFVLGIRLILRHVKWPDWQKALVLLAVFAVSISFVAYRFDDYHVLTDAFTVYSVLFLLEVKQADSARRLACISMVLGLLSGLAIVTRVNDGVAMALASFLSLLVIVPKNKFGSGFLFILTAALAAVAIVLATQDTLHDYAMNSIFHAAGSKGGGSILFYPLRLPWTSLKDFRRISYGGTTIFTMLICGLWATALHPFRRGERPQRIWWLLTALVVTFAPLPFYVHQMGEGKFVEILSAPFDLIIFGMAILFTISLVQSVLGKDEYSEWRPRKILLLFPLGALASGATSSGGEHVGIYAPIALWILLLCAVPLIEIPAGWQRRFFLAVMAWLSLTSFIFRAETPFLWHSYLEKPDFVDRVWYRHPLYGPMYVNREQLAMFESIAEETRGGNGAQEEILSLPFPYVNYFTGIPPWHGYVQTFFDTSTKETIDQLIRDLHSAPPKWVLYQRQLRNLRDHELEYNHGKPLPHRALDELLQSKVFSGEWTVVKQQEFGDGSSWYLIRTESR